MGIDIFNKPYEFVSVNVVDALIFVMVFHCGGGGSEKW